jgi:hypothetical protein
VETRKTWIPAPQQVLGRLFAGMTKKKKSALEILSKWRKSLEHDK